MTPGPAPLRPVRVASRRASRADRTRQDSQSSVRTVLVRTSREVVLPPCPSVSRPPRQAPSNTQRRRAPGQWHKCGREVGPPTRARGRDQGNRMVTSRDGAPRQPGRGRTSVARRRGPRPTRWPRLLVLGSRHGTPTHSGPAGPGVRCLCTVFHWQVGLGSRAPDSGVTTTSRAGRARRNPSFPARPSPFQRARLESLWRMQLVFFFSLSLAGAWWNSRRQLLIATARMRQHTLKAIRIPYVC